MFFLSMRHALFNTRALLKYRAMRKKSSDGAVRNNSAMGIFRIFAFLLCLNLTNLCHGEVPWLTNLERHLSNDHKGHQIFLFLDKRSSQSKTQQMVASYITERFLTVLMCLNEGNREEVIQKTISQFRCDDGLRSSSLLIFLRGASTDVKLLEMNIEALHKNKFFLTRIQPRMLIISEKSSEVDISVFLRYAWSKKFLDCSVLNLSPKINRVGKLQEREDYRNVDVALHHYNPFTEVFTKRSLASATEIFPRKLDNLHQYKLQVFYRNEMPFFEYEKKKKLMKGSWGLIFRALQDKLNFSENMDRSWQMPALLSSQALNDLQLATSNASIEALLSGKRHMAVNYICYPDWVRSGDMFRFERTTATMTIKMQGVVTMAGNDVVIVSKLFGWLLLTTFICVVITVVAARLMRFTKDVWTAMFVFEAIMGIGVENPPTRVVEQVLYGCLQLLSVAYGMSIIGEMVDINVHKVIEPIASVEDAIDLGVKFVNVHPHILKIFEEDGVNLPVMPVQHEFCRKSLEKMMKPSLKLGCFENNFSVMLWLSMQGGQSDALMTIVEQEIQMRWCSFIFEPRSPFVERFDQVLKSLVESGLIYKWQNVSAYYETAVPIKVQKDFSEIIYLSSFLATGCLLAGLVLLGEILVHRRQSKINENLFKKTRFHSSL